MKIKKKIVISVLVGGIIFGLAPTTLNADELANTVVEEISEVTSSTRTTRALTDAAFPASSQPLHDAILANYPQIKTDTSFTYITVAEANAYSNDIDLKELGISGTLNGIENFTSLKTLNLNNNNFTGEIPAAIGNMQGLLNLYLAANQLSGEIPTSLMSLNKLRMLYLQNNNLTGTIPDNFSNFTVLVSLFLDENGFTGNLPITLASLPTLHTVRVQGNKLTGTLPVSWTTNPKLTDVNVSNNAITGAIPSEFGSLTQLARFNASNNMVTGNVDEIFATTPSLKMLNVYNTSTNQVRPATPSLIAFLYNILNEDGMLKDGLTLADVEQLKDEIGKLKDIYGTNDEYFSPDNPNAYSWVKDSIFPVIAEQKEAVLVLSGMDAIENLFTDSGHIDIKSSTDQSAIDDAQSIVDQLSDSVTKANFQKEIDKAQAMLNAKKAVENLFKADGSEKINDGLTQKNIDDAQELVNKITNGTLKDELQKRINDAQAQLNTSNKVIISPSTKSPFSKPSSSTGSVQSSMSVATADETKLVVLYGLLALSLLTIVVVFKKEKVKK